MKKIILICLVSFSLMTMASAQTVAEQQRTLLVKKTADWCPNCGNWGWGFMKDIIADNVGEAVAIGMHFSGGLQTNDGQDIVANFGGSGQPVFYVNGVNKFVGSGNAGSKRTEIENNVDDNFALPPDVNCGMYMELVSGNIEVTAKARFYENVTGNYYMGMYIVENDVLHNQTPIGSSLHPEIMRTSMSDAFGDLIATGSANAGDEIILNYTVPVDANWNTDKVSVVGIIWKENGNDYDFVNVYRVSEFGVTTSAFTIDGLSTFEVNPNVVRDVANVKVELTEMLPSATITVSNINGQQVQTIHSGNLSSGTHQFDLNRNNLSAGQYFVTISSQKANVTKKIIIQ